MQAASMREVTENDDGESIRFGIVAAIDLANATVEVDCGDARSDPIRFLLPRSGTTRIWNPPAVGEQVVLLCPNGDLDGAIVIGSLHKNDMPAADNQDRFTAKFDDGTTLSYDPVAHKLDCILPASATATITAPGGITLNASDGITINGDVTLNGKLSASNDVLAAGKSLKSHKHIGVQAGSGVSGVPQ